MQQLVVEEMTEGTNTLMYRLNGKYVLYEKLANTLHQGTFDELKELKDLADSVHYNPLFESTSLKSREHDKLESLLLSLTDNCDLNCGYCIYSGNYTGERTHGSEVMSWKTAKNALDLAVQQSDAHQHVLIGFYGGEPLTEAGLLRQIITYAKDTYLDRQFVFSVTTNFVSARTNLEYLIKEGIYCMVSLDGPKEVHDNHRVTKNGKPTYDLILKNLDDLEHLEAGFVRTHIGLNATNHDPEDFGKIVEYLKTNETSFHVVRMNTTVKKGLKHMPTFSSTNNVYFRYASEYVSAILEGKEPSSILKHFFDESVKKVWSRSELITPETLRLEGCCYPGNRKLFVDTDGSFYMCEKFGQRVSIGNTEIGIDKRLVNKSINDFTEIRNATCTDGCWAQRMCYPCIQSAKDPEDELSVQGLRSMCHSLKQEVITGISLYISLIQKDPSVVSSYFNKTNG